jgi:hypothetical protein
MKATAAISIAALVAALAVAPALALDLNAGVGVTAGANVDTTVTGAIGANASADNADLNLRLDGLLKLINDTDYSNDSFSAVADLSATSLVKVDDLFDLDAQSKIDAAVQANLDEHEDLSAAIDANASLKAWLDANGIDANSVIAIDVSADGSVEVYEG